MTAITRNVAAAVPQGNKEINPTVGFARDLCDVASGMAIDDLTDEERAAVVAYLQAALAGEKYPMRPGLIPIRSDHRRT